MTKSTITRERVQWLHDAAIELASTKLKMTMKPDEVLALTSALLAAMDSEPVAWTWHYREQWHVTNDKCRAEFVATDGDVAVLPLYRHAQPAPEKYNIGDATMRHIFTPTGMTNVSDMQAVFDRVEAVLVGMDQPAPVVPDGYVMVPKEPTKEMIDAGWLYYMTTKLPSSKGTYKAMLAAAPQSPGSEPATVPGKWIPVSERMPDDEQEVLTINKMGHRFVSFFDKHSGLFFDRLDAPAACCIEHVLVTHWMPLPAAPQEVK